MMMGFNIACFAALGTLLVLTGALYVFMKKKDVQRSWNQAPFERGWSKWNWGVTLVPALATICGYSSYCVIHADLVWPTQQRDRLTTRSHGNTNDTAPTGRETNNEDRP